MLSHHDKILLQKALTYANGYRELGMHDHALKELDALEPLLSGERDAERMRLAVLMEAERWRKALPIANKLAATDTSEPDNLINLAYVTRRAKTLREAQVILQRAAKRFPLKAIVHYNLSCYAACQDRLEEARTHLVEALRLDPSYRKLAEEDSDLGPLQSWIASLPKAKK